MTRKRYTDILNNKERREARAENARLAHLARRGVSPQRIHRNPVFELQRGNSGNNTHDNPMYSPSSASATPMGATLRQQMRENRKNAMRAHFESLPSPSSLTQPSLTQRIWGALPDSLKMRYLYYRGG